ncbi:MAG: LLM class flavin-dependent oxidoreductase [Candidatus Bathyarchaeia archaeon]|jgi:alkanesulfonate monooxygenase SsuD/methylene tetrahydromethanopterin reductase-like flavin-dependent oxidoreductase (luciferase family)
MDGRKRVGLYLIEKHEIKHSIELARVAEENGFDCVWQGEEYPPFRDARDSVIPLGAIAAVTKSIKLGTGVLHTWTRNVMTLANTFATLDELSNGRSMLGIGILWQPMADMVGIVRRHTLKAMREHVTALCDLFAMKTVNVDGEFVKLHNVRLLKKPISIPVYVGATGFKMMELAGEIADGILMNYLVSPEYNKRALEALSKGAAKAKRRLERLDRPQLVACSMDADADKALDKARRVVIEYLFLEPHIMKASGIKQDVLEEIHKTLGGWPAKPEKLQKALELVDDDLVKMICAVGTAEDCKQKLREYEATGTTCPVICPIGGRVEEMIHAFSEGY